MLDQITIGEVARRSGVASSALRFYEERGLISSDRAVACRLTAAGWPTPTTAPRA